MTTARSISTGLDRGMTSAPTSDVIDCNTMINAYGVPIQNPNCRSRSISPQQQQHQQQQEQQHHHHQTTTDCPIDVAKSFHFGNAAPPFGATNPLDGAGIIYNRNASFSGSRFTPFNITINVWDENCQDITQDPEVNSYLLNAFDDVYQWNKTQWSKEFVQSHRANPQFNSTLIIDTKANMFWELLSQAFGERVMNHHNSTNSIPLILNYGPKCFQTSKFMCNDKGLSQVAHINIATKIDGARDVLNPVPREIIWSATANPFIIENTNYKITMVSDEHVAGKHQEHLDLLPYVNGQRLNESVTLLAQSTPGSYPDYNLVFIPFRHLVLQGAVQNATLPEASIHYDSIDSLLKFANKTLQGLMSVDVAPEIAYSLTPFFNTTYYYMYNELHFSFGGHSGIPGYRDYILGAPYGISQGLRTRYSYIRLECAPV